MDLEDFLTANVLQRMSATEVSNGLVLPYAAITIAGKGGAAGVLLITFMAVTSTLSAQVIAVSSIISFDIYRTYINKRARDLDVIRWSHYGVVIFGVFSAAFSTMLHYVGVDLGWTLYMLGMSHPDVRLQSFLHRLGDLTFAKGSSPVLAFSPPRSQSSGVVKARSQRSPLPCWAWPPASPSGSAPPTLSTAG